MGEVSTIGLDIAKSVFQVHGVDADGAVVIRKRISRAKVLEFFATLPSCLVGVEARPSAHHWSRKLQALGHTVRLMPPTYVKALSQAEQKRRQRCRRDLRGSNAAVDAFRANKI
jgi:transposase